jgi:hypothetical protein
MAGTRACMSCPQNLGTWTIKPVYEWKFNYATIDDLIIRNKKITEKFEDGKLTERIIE